MSKERTQTILTVFISLLFSILSVFIYDRFFAQKVVVYDIKGFVSEQKELMLSGRLTDEQLEANFNKLERLMNSIPKRKVVLMSDVVLRNGEAVNDE